MNSSVRALALATGLMLGALPAFAQKTVRAEVRADRTNLRAQPSRDSEVLASLRKGEVLEVRGEETSPGDKELWSRVVLPSSVPVWIHSPGVDKAGVVKNEKIYFRAGPGKNYSVLGHLRRGSSVSILREFDGWLQISPPPGAVAFVASRLLGSPGSASPAQTPSVQSSTAPVASSGAPTLPAPERAAPSPAGRPTNAAPAARLAPPMPSPSPSTASVPPPVRPAAVASAPATGTPPPPPALQPSPAAPRTAPPAPTGRVPEGVPVRSPEPPARPTAEASPAATAPTPAEEPADPPAPRTTFRGSPREIASRSAAAPREFPLLASDPDPGPPKPEDALVEPRPVTREGTVRRTLSPHAPSNFELRDNFYGEGVIDYLYIEPQDDLKKFLGQRVRVEGEEYRDSRWRTPVLKIKSVELAP